MDFIEAAIIGQIISERADQNARNQLIAGHVAQGHSLQSATVIVDQYIAQQKAAAPVDPVMWLFNLFGGLVLVAGALFGVGVLLTMIYMAFTP